MNFSVCVDAVYMGKDLFTSLDAIQKCGLNTFEFWGWEDKPMDNLADYVKASGMTVAAFCTKFISLTDPSKRDDYIEGLKETVEWADKLGCKTLISQVGADTGARREFQADSLTEGLIKSEETLKDTGITLVIEPLNTRVDHKGYFLSSSDETADILKAVNSPSVKMLFDIYHQQISEGDIIRHIQEYIQIIGHFHAAGNPGRHELYHSELDYNKVFEAINALGYDKYMGLEYFPENDPKIGLKKLSAL